LNIKLIKFTFVISSTFYFLYIIWRAFDRFNSVKYVLQGPSIQSI